MTANIIFNIERMNRTNSLRIRRYEKQGKKDDVIKAIEDIDNKIKKPTNKSRVSQLKKIRKELLNHYSKPGKNFVDIHNNKKRSFRCLDEVLDVERKLEK